MSQDGERSRSSDLNSYSEQSGPRASSRTVQLLSGRWTLAILAELRDGGRRYQNLHDALNGISYKVLTDTLRRAERDGLIARHLDSSRVETATLYQLTGLGRSLDEPLGVLDRLG
jgi:DNA-binding HxlR family transcriptional regulator